MPAPDPKQTKHDRPPLQRVGFRPMPWLIFLAITGVLLAGDLWLKDWSFKNVADTPVRVRTADAGGPEVLVPAPGDIWVPAFDLGLTQKRSHVPYHEPTVVVPKLLNFQLTLNTGAVFGSGAGGRPIFISISIIAAIVILVMMARSPSKAYTQQVGMALILAGDLGNLYDRIFFSAVRDMLHMLPTTKLWPWIFNPADVFLLAGVGLLLLLSFKAERQHKRKAESKAKAGAKP